MYSYILKEGDDPLFTFTTKNGLHYYVAFRKMELESNSFHHLYSIDFWEIHHQKFIKDELIGLTIIEIIQTFYLSNPNALLHYICDSSDNKQNSRSKLFDKWYNKSLNETFSKLTINYEIPEEEINYKLEFIFQSNYYNLDELRENVIQQLDDFSNYK